MPIDVKDAGGVTRTLQTPNANGRSNASGSRPVALSSEDLTVLQNLLGALQATLQVNDPLGAPVTNAVALTPSDSALITPVPRAVYVGTGGNLVMRGTNGSADATWRNVPSGSLIPFQAVYVRATNTTATDLLALY